MTLKFRRLIALSIDYIIIFYSTYILFDFIYNLFPIMIVNILIGVIEIIFFINLLIRKDILIGYESIGKKITRLKVYDENGKRIENKRLLMDRIYQSFWSFPFYPIMILISNKSQGDIKLKTTVK